MPQGDRTGPAGMGQMTGRGAGFCAGYGTPGYANRGYGMGYGGCGRGFGRGWGWRNMFRASGVPGWARFNRIEQPSAVNQNELEILKSQSESMQQQLQQINQRIEQLQNQNQ